MFFCKRVDIFLLFLRVLTMKGGNLGIKVFGNHILGFRASDGANFNDYFKESEIVRLELKDRMQKERENRGLI